MQRLVSNGIEGTFDPTDNRPTEELPALREGVAAFDEASPLLPDDGETQTTFLSDSMAADLGVDTEFCLRGTMERVGEGFNKAAIPASESPPVSMLLRRFFLADGPIFSSDVDSACFAICSLLNVDAAASNPTFLDVCFGSLSEGVFLPVLASR